MYTIEQINNALNAYVKNEIIPTLPTAMKWLVATYTDSMRLDANSAHKLLSNPMIAPLNIEKDGMYDVDVILDNLEKNASAYGPMELSLKFLGTVKFNNQDIAKLKQYLKQQQ